MLRMPQDTTGATPLAGVLILTGLCSLGTGVFWHGIPFIAKHSYQFGQTRTLVLYAAMGVIYATGAFTAGRLTRRLERWVSPRGVLVAVIGTQAVVCVCPIAFEGEWALWLAAGAGTFFASIIWPVIESYLTAGRHGPSMRSAIGWFNFTWAVCVAIPLFVMAPILQKHGEWTIGGFAAANLVGLAVLAWFPSRPGHHDPDLADAHVAAEYPALLQSARVLLPLSYVLSSAMSPILPYRFEALGVAVWWETPATATWTIVRVLAFAVMWRLGFWRGRWGALLLGALTMTGGFALVVAGPSLLLVLVGLGGLGVGVGVIYYAALYYAMSVGRAAIDAGGTHEGLIGTGYVCGPLAGLLGGVLAPGRGAGIVGVVWTVTALGTIAALRPYLRARRRRRRERSVISDQ